jgi:hypothetical protein
MQYHQVAAPSLGNVNKIMIFFLILKQLKRYIIVTSRITPLVYVPLISGKLKADNTVQ